MPWESLSKSLDSKPHVLAGPLLRKVTSKTVTVWLAVRKPGNVILTVMDTEGKRIMDGEQHTIAVGSNLHLVSVTAKQSALGEELTEGFIYLYDIMFNFDGAAVMDLATATGNIMRLLNYEPFSLPSFCLPPSDLNSLRLLGGSCRIPHGNGPDALALADKLIAESVSNPATRPHQLLLTGDQIYADDVAISLLVMLSDAAEVLLGWNEILPVETNHGGPASVNRLPPFLRREILEKAGFTSEDLDAHLMSLGEYLCMYLFVWSDVLWRGNIMPTFADVLAVGHAGISDPIAFGHWLGERVRHNDEHRVDESENSNLRLFILTLEQVRRVLANIPTYMILDDHDFTDDWNMTRDFCKNIYGNPLGLRVAQNALVAYALCQHWGNAPEQFDSATPAGLESPGFTLLRLLDGLTAEKYAQNSSTILSLVGLHDDVALQARQDNAVFHDNNSLSYNFTIEGPAHQVIITDTRTWRSFPGDHDEAGELLPKEQLVQQITNTPPTGNRLLLVVLSTNAPPVEPIRTATRHPIISNFFEHFPDIFEAWELPSVALDQLIATLTEKLPKVGDQRRGSIILISGDVHFSFASRLLYKAKSRLGDAQPQPTTAVIAQLVASSLRKQTDRTLGFHREGYRFTPHLSWILWPVERILHSLVPEHTPEGYIGWNVATTVSSRRVGEIGVQVGNTWVKYVPLEAEQPSIAVSPDRLALGLLGLFDSIAIDSQAPPDYSYRLDYLLPSGHEPLPVPLPNIGPLPTGTTPEQRIEVAAAYLKAARAYNDYNSTAGKAAKIVGTNNLCEITFEWSDNNEKVRKVNLTSRWHWDDISPLQSTIYTVSLDPDDAAFPEIKPRMVP